MVDYRKLRPNNITSPEFRHVFLLLFWIAFGACFGAVEQLIPRAVWHTVWCPLDDRIPFCEWFFIPYMFWFVFLVGMHLYLLLFDIPAFKKFMYFIMITYTTTMIIYFIYPTCQELRPTQFPRDNFLTRFAAGFYQFDTNTNVCPSLHCVGSMAVAFAAWDTERFRKPVWRVAFMGTALLISVSTVFVKQHSVLDVLWAWLLCAAAYVIVYVAIPKFSKVKV
ncbi:MAG: phosphatase PAP2 family protein [Oscillospiraceae bacterium]|nr:phosphatase PAP2 family protein [Oscillospiraceae bacterium]